MRRRNDKRKTHARKIDIDISFSDGSKCFADSD